MYRGRIMWSQNHVPICFCTWHVLKAWCLCSMEKIKDLKVRCVVLDYLHTVMLMSINPNETIKSLKACGKETVVESFDNLQPSFTWIRYFWAYYCVSNLFFLIWHVLKPFCYGCITSCILIFHTYSNYIMGCKYVVHVHANL